MRRKRLLSWLLTFAMIAGMFVAPASAEGDTITISGNGSEPKTGQMTITLKIKGTPTASDFTFTPPSELSYDGQPKTASVTGKDGMGNITLDYYSGDTKLSGAPTADGTYTVKVSVTEGTEYKAATDITSASWTFTIAPYSTSMTITLEIGAATVTTAPTASKNLKYNGSAQALVTAGAASGGEMQYALSENGTTAPATGWGTAIPKGTDAGTYHVWYRAASTHGNTEAVCVPVSIAADTYAMTIKLVIKPAQTISAENVTATYGDTDKRISASVTTPATGGGAISYAVKDGSEAYIDVDASTGALTIKKAGTATVVVTAAETNTGGTDNKGYAKATKEVTVTISKADVALSYATTQVNKYAADSAFTNPLTNAASVTVTYGSSNTGAATVNASTGEVTIAGVGTTTITASYAGDDNHNAASASYTLSVSNKPAQTITASDVTATYGDTGVSVSAGTNGGGTLSYAIKSGDAVTVNPSTGALTIVKAGTATVTVTAAETATYAAATKDVTVTVNTKAMTVSASGYSGYYDGAAHGITVTVSDPASGYTVKYGEAQGTYDLDTSPTLTEAGTKTVYYQVTADNYTTYTGSATITVNAKQTQTITAENVTATYGDTGKSVIAGTNGGGTLSYAVTSGDAVTVDANTGALTIVKAGTATVTVTAAETATYQQATKDVTVTVNKATPTAAAPSATATYGQTLADVTLTNPTGNTAGAWAWAVASTTSVGNVGTNTFKANFTPTDTGNYNSVSNVDVTVTVAKANPTAAAPSATATYGQTLADVTLTNPAGNTAGTWTWVDAATTSVGNAGSKTFKANFTPTDSANYNGVTNVDVSLTVNKVNATVTAAPTAKTGLTFNGGNQALVTAGTASGGTMRYALGTESAAEGSYSESIPEGRAAKTYYVWYKVVGDENHNDSTEARISVVIGQTSLDAQGVTIYAIPDQNSTGSQLTPKPVVKHLGYLLVEDEDYTLSYGENKDVGTGAGFVTVTGKGGYNGTLTKTFNIILPAYNGVLTVTAPSPYTYGDTLGTAPTANSTESLSGERVTVYYATTPSGTGTAWSSNARLDAGTYYVWAEVAKTVTHDAATSERVQFTVNKATPTAPSGVLRASYTDTYKVTLTIPSGKTYADYEYSIDGTNWKSLPSLTGGAFTPDGLAANTTYTLSLRTKADSNNNASAAATATLKTPAKYLLSYDANGSTASVSASVEYDSGTTVTAAAAITRAGYTFAGWKTDATSGTDYAAGATFTISANTTLYAQWTANTYTVKYDANGGTGTIADGSFTYGTAAALSDGSGLSRSGYTFRGWATSASGDVVYSKGQKVSTLTTDQNGTVTLYAVWTQDTYKVSGTVMEELDGTTDKSIVAGVTVKIVRGNVEFASTTTGDDGTYEFTGVPTGTYNIVATRTVDSKTQTMTALVEVKSNQTVDTIVLPPSKINSVLSVTGDSTPPVMVGGLEAVAKDEAETSKEVTVTMTVEKKDESSASAEVKQQIEEIKEAVAADTSTDSGNTELEVLDVKVEKKVDNGAATPVTETSQVVEIIVSFNMNGRFGFSLYRHHDGKAEAFQSRSSRFAKDNFKDGYYYADKANGLFYIYTNRFSTYAIGYEEGTSYTATVNNGTGGGDYAEGATVTITADAAPSGKVFDKWTTSDGVSFANASSATTTFTMPAKAVTVTANYKTASTPYTPSSGGNGGYSPTTYTPVITDTQHGKVTVSPTSPTSGAKVTITVKPDAGYEVDTLTLTDASGKSVTYTDNGNSTYTYTQPSSKVTVNVTFKPEQAAPTADVFAPYNDLDKTKWYADGIRYVLENGIMSGYGNGTFGPNDNTSRAMMAQILFNIEGGQSVSDALKYSDVNGADWYAEAIRWASAENIMDGYGNGVFGPNDAMTREQFVTIMYRYAKKKGIDVSVGEDTNILSYDDAFDVSEWAIPAMQWAVGSGLITGRTNTTLNPKDTATRAEIATIIMRYCAEIAK